MAEGRIRTPAPSVPPILPDRRSGPRVPLSIWVEERAGPGVLFRRAGNLSIGGIYLEVAVPQALGTLVELELQLPGDPGGPIRVRGVVVSASSDADRPGMGLRFVDVSSELQARIVACVDGELGRKEPPGEP